MSVSTKRRSEDPVGEIEDHFAGLGARYDERAFGTAGQQWVSQRELDSVRTALEGLPRGARVLDAGCGNGRVTQVLAGELGFAVTAFDPVPDMLVATRRRSPGVSTVLARLGEPIPLPSAAFDAVVALEVLEHMPKARRHGFVADCLRVARRGAVFTCPDGRPGPSVRGYARTMRCMIEPDVAKEVITMSQNGKTRSTGARSQGNGVSPARQQATPGLAGRPLEKSDSQPKVLTSLTAIDQQCLDSFQKKLQMVRDRTAATHSSASRGTKRSPRSAGVGARGAIASHRIVIVTLGAERSRTGSANQRGSASMRRLPAVSRHSG
jgi:ubiquinone/menaquinone biosynthesis C-methylase UbiE